MTGEVFSLFGLLESYLYLMNFGMLLLLATCLPVFLTKKSCEQITFKVCECGQAIMLHPRVALPVKVNRNGEAEVQAFVIAIICSACLIGLSLGYSKKIARTRSNCILIACYSMPFCNYFSCPVDSCFPPALWGRSGRRDLKPPPLLLSLLFFCLTYTHSGFPQSQFWQCMTLCASGVPSARSCSYLP